MGDAVRSKRMALKIGLSWALVLALAGVSTAPAAGEAADSVRMPAAPLTAAADPVNLSRLAIVDGAAGSMSSEIELDADAALVWTSYRNEDGQLVIEIPNSRPDPQVTTEEVASGLVAAVRVTVEETEGRPLTRLTVVTRQDAQHSLVAAGNGLRVEMTPVGQMAARETVEVETAPLVAAAPAPAPAAWTAAGTPDRPRVAPAPSGPAATRLDDVAIVAQGDETVIRVTGNGEFAYSTFALENPDRFVIDLDGVVNQGAGSSAPLADRHLDRVRVSQFRQQPQPVSRIVFDLKGAAAPQIQRSAEGLLVRFGAGTTLVAAEAAPIAKAAASPAPEPTPAPVPAAVQVATAVPPPAPAAEEEAAAAPAPAVLPAPAQQDEIETTSDVVAFAPAAERPAAAPTAAPVVQFAPPAKNVRDTSAFEAANMQVAEEAPRPAAPSPAFPQQTVGGPKKEYVGDPISLSLKDADIKDVLRSFAKISGLNVVLQPGVGGTVTVELESVPWDQALDQILKINNLGYELEGNIMRIAPRNVLQNEAKEQQALQQAQALSIPLRTVIKRLSYSTASEVSRLLSTGGGVGGGILSQRGSVTIDARTNTLIIKELPTYIDTVIAVIETLDIPEPQVMIEARIIETTKRFSRTLGIRWGVDGISDQAHGNTTGLQFPNHGTSSAGVNLLTGGANGFIDMFLGNVLDTFTLDARLQAAEGEGLINVLSAPKIATLNNQSASIQSGLQIPIQTVANNTVTVQFVNATLKLDVTPQVTAEGTVLMTINVQKREPQLAFAVVGATNAPIATKEAQTRVIVRDGGTTVIGGIYKVSTDQGQDRVPGLANIPVLGHLFKNNRRDDANEELLIFITPRVVKL
jgi:type IV pilus secretin PilQ/predicted competence protein